MIILLLINNLVDNDDLRRLYGSSRKRKFIDIPNIIPPQGGFRIIINDNKSTSTNNKIIALTLIGSPDTYGVLIANSPDFENKKKL